MRSIKYGILAIFLLLVAFDLDSDVDEFIDNEDLNPYQIVQALIATGVYGFACFCISVCCVIPAKESENEQNSTGNN